MKFSFPAIVLLFIFSCTKNDSCPPDVFLGSLSLHQDSRDYLPFEGIKHLVFVQYQDSIPLDTAYLDSNSGLINDSSRTVIANICISTDNIERSDTFYLSEHKTIDYFDSDTSRKFRIVGNLGIAEDYLSDSSTVSDPVLYDELKLTVHRSNPSISGAVATILYVANDRDNKTRMSDTLKSRINKYSLIPQITLDKFVYDSVYEYRNGDSIYFYFKPLSGVVAFRDLGLGNKWWHLRGAN